MPVLHILLFKWEQNLIIYVTCDELLTKNYFPSEDCWHLIFRLSYCLELDLLSKSCYDPGLKTKCDRISSKFITKFYQFQGLAVTNLMIRNHVPFQSCHGLDL